MRIDKHSDLTVSHFRFYNSFSIKSSQKSFLDSTSIGQYFNLQSSLAKQFKSESQYQSYLVMKESKSLGVSVNQKHLSPHFFFQQAVDHGYILALLLNGESYLIQGYFAAFNLVIGLIDLETRSIILNMQSLKNQLENVYSFLQSLWVTS